MGRTALAAGLADTVGSYADCLASAAALAASNNPFQALTKSVPLRADASATETTTMTDSSPAVDASAAIHAEPVAAPATGDRAQERARHHRRRAVGGPRRCRAQIVALSGERATLMADLDTTRAALTEATAKVKAADSARITAKVDALVGLKLTPAEREEYLDMALENEGRFDRLMQKRPDLALTDKRLVPDTGNETRATDKPDGPLAVLNTPPTPTRPSTRHPAPHRAQGEVMRQRPDLCETANPYPSRHGDSHGHPAQFYEPQNPLIHNFATTAASPSPSCQMVAFGNNDDTITGTSDANLCIGIAMEAVSSSEAGSTKRIDVRLLGSAIVPMIGDGTVTRSRFRRGHWLRWQVTDTGSTPTRAPSSAASSPATRPTATVPVLIPDRPRRRESACSARDDRSLATPDFPSLHHGHSHAQLQRVSDPRRQAAVHHGHGLHQSRPHQASRLCRGHGRQDQR